MSKIARAADCSQIHVHFYSFLHCFVNYLVSYRVIQLANACYMYMYVNEVDEQMRSYLVLTISLIRILFLLLFLLL